MTDRQEQFNDSLKFSSYFTGQRTSQEAKESFGILVNQGRDFFTNPKNSWATRVIVSLSDFRAFLGF